MTGKLPPRLDSASTVLVAPLDWGLGHLTRCIPIIRALRQRGVRVLLAAQGAQAGLAQGEFPGIECLPIPHYGIRYAASRLGLYASFPSMLVRVLVAAGREHRRIEQVVRDYGVDAIISDSRFGCYTRSAYCVYLTHQVYVRFPRGFSWLGRLVHWAHRRVIDRYDELWIPDSADRENLTGELTHGCSLPARHRFVGPLSRFDGSVPVEAGAEAPDLLVMLSGPEPQRTILERIVRRQLKGFHGRALVLLGKPDGESYRCEGAHQFVSHLPGERLHALLFSAKALICRAGYTTVMELVSLGRTAVLIPTPGQTEQEYLAQRLARQGRFVVREQYRFDLLDALAALAEVPTTAPLECPGLLDEAIDALVGGQVAPTAGSLP